MTWRKVRIRSELQAKNMAKEELKNSFNSTSKSTPAVCFEEKGYLEEGIAEKVEIMAS